MRRTVFIIPALVGALGALTPAFAQSDLLGDEDYPADDYAAPPTEEYAGGDYDSSNYDDVDSNGYADTGSYDDSYADDSYADRTVAPETFRSALAPYGRWVRTPEYGMVWIPSRSVVGSDFVPYATGGSWQYSNAGWSFASQWNWGWAPFHYGRWYRAPRLGWVWVPGSVWAPAWVDWRYGDGYIGWAPLPPRRYAAALRYHGNWFFCSVRDMWRPHVFRYRVRSTPRLFQVAVLSRRPVRHGRARWFAGPSRQVVERAIGRRVDRADVRPNRHERVNRRVRQDAPRQRPDRQRVERPDRQRVERPDRQRVERPDRQRVERPDRQRVERPDRQRVERPDRQRVERPDRQRVQRPERQQVQRPERQRPERQARPERQQVREQRQQQRAQRQEQRRVERQQARPARQQPSRERRHHPDR